jgi:hypothetical protein
VDLCCTGTGLQVSKRELGRSEVKGRSISECKVLFRSRLRNREGSGGGGERCQVGMVLVQSSIDLECTTILGLESGSRIFPYHYLYVVISMAQPLIPFEHLDSK